MANCAIVGINWGDEGKGRMVDAFAGQFDIVVRSQGGTNAGHTVVNQYGRFVLNLLPAGIFTPGVLSVIGTGTAVDIKHLSGEIEKLRAKGVKITPENLLVDRRATMVLPVHPAQERWEEGRLGNDSTGSMLRGMGPAFADRHLLKSVPLSCLTRPDELKQRVKKLIDWKNAVSVPGYGVHRIDLDETMDWIASYAQSVVPFLGDAGEVLERAVAEGKSILFEGQAGALRDVLYGIYPYSAASSTLAAGIPMGSGLPTVRIDRVIGVVKAYSTCVGKGPFAGELDGDEAEELREAGGEYGAATGRPRRVAWFDAVASREGIRLQGADALALTKLDVLSAFQTIPVCVGYSMGGYGVKRFPETADIGKCECVYEYLPGWKSDISGCRTWDSLPSAARDYVKFIEKELGRPIRYVSVGAERESLIEIHR